MRLRRDERGFPGPFGIESRRLLRRDRSRCRAASTNAGCARLGGSCRSAAACASQAQARTTRDRRRLRQPVRAVELGTRAARPGAASRTLRASPRVSMSRPASSSSANAPAAPSSPASRRRDPGRTRHRPAISPRRAGTAAHALFLTGGLRVDGIQRDALDGDSERHSARGPRFGADTVVSVEPEDRRRVVRRARARGTSPRFAASAGTGIRPPDAFEIAFTDNPSLKPERSKSLDAGIDQAFVGGHGAPRGHGVLQHLRRPDRRGRLVRGASRYQHRQHLERPCARARARGTARPPLRLRPVDLQRRVGYTFLDTEILAVDDGERGTATLRSSATAAAAAEAPCSRSMPSCTRGPLSPRFVRGGGRRALRDVEPIVRDASAASSTRPATRSGTSGASWRVPARGDLRPVDEPFRSRATRRRSASLRSGAARIAGLRIAAGR